MENLEDGRPKLGPDVDHGSRWRRDGDSSIRVDVIRNEIERFVHGETAVSAIPAANHDVHAATRGVEHSPQCRSRHMRGRSSRSTGQDRHRDLLLPSLRSSSDDKCSRGGLVDGSLGDPSLNLPSG